MAVKERIEQLAGKINANPFAIDGMNTVYQFNLTGQEEGTYQIKISDNFVEFSEESIFQPNCILQMTSSDFIKLSNGELNAQMAFMMGQLKVKGDVNLGIKLNTIMQFYR